MKKNSSTVASVLIIFVLSIIFAVIACDRSDSGYEYRGSESESEQEAMASSDNAPGAETETDTQLPQFSGAPKEYFDDALFIGDSRSVGLYEYGGIESATFFAASGLSVYKIENERIHVDGIGKLTLGELLSSKRFGKIYVMMGINELGYDQNTSLKKYARLIDSIRAAQPEALVFIEANLHVSKAMSDESKIYNNKNIDAFNSAIALLADGKDIFYIDINPIFDDGSGNLDEKYTFDRSHLLGKYYRKWAEWLSEQAILK